MSYSVVGRSAIARPCPDGPGAPSGDKTGYSVSGSALWRSPCDEIDICGITDTFTRTLASSWGTCDAGLPWLDVPQSGELGDDWSAEIPSGVFSVDGSRGLMSYPADLNVSNDPVQMLRVDPGLTYPIDVSFEVQGLGPTDGNGDNYVNLQMYFGPHFHWTLNTWLVFSSYYDDDPVEHGFYYRSSDQGGYVWDYTEGTWFVVLEGDISAVWVWRIQIDTTGARAKKWVKGTTEPDWQLTLTWVTVPSRAYFRNFAWETAAFNSPGPTTQPVIALDNIDIAGVNRCTLVWYDAFDRTVAAGSGLGSRYTWTAWDSGWGSQAESLTYVDGAVGRMPGGVDGSNYDSYYLNVPALPTAGTAQIDFYVPAAWDLGLPEIGLAFPLPAGFYGDVYAQAGLSGSDWYLRGRGSETVAPGPATFPTEAATWYTMKMGWDAAGNVSQKVWKTGFAEPDWMQSYSAPDTYQRDLAGPLLDCFYGVAGGDLMFDNLAIWRS